MNNNFRLNPVNALIQQIYPYQPPQVQRDPNPRAPARHGDFTHTYVVQIEDQVERFKAYHAQFAQPGIPEQMVDNYVKSLIEQMVSHFESNQSMAVQSFVGHYVKMITENVSPNWIYHPLRFVKQMDVDGYQHYVYCLYGFAEDIYNTFVSHGLFSPAGTLLASYEAYELGTLYLVLRPELPDALFY